MKIQKVLSLVVVASLSGPAVLSATAMAQGDTSSSESQTGHSPRSGKMVTKEYIGTVKEYQAGDKLKITTDKGDESFDLNKTDMRTMVDPGLAVGNRVRVTVKTDEQGVKTMSVEMLK
jgi:hypothetical protein